MEGAAEPAALRSRGFDLYPVAAVRGHHPRGFDLYPVAAVRGHHPRVIFPRSSLREFDDHGPYRLWRAGGVPLKL